MIYICLILWIVYSIIEGKREANFWHHLIKSTDYKIFKDKDSHPLFAVQRGLMLVALSLVSYLILDSILLALYLFIMNCLIFSFFHNGSMYLERYKMSQMVSPNDSSKWIYRMGWWDQSTTSTAWSTKFMTPLNRTIQVILGLAGYAIIHLF